MDNRRRLTLIVCFALALNSLGCAHFKEKVKRELEEKKKVEERKEFYATLTSNIKKGSIKEGSTTAEVRELYGEPTDTFRSGSSVSSMDIWTYEKVMENPNDQDWQPVRLYFANDKLLRWTY